MADNPQIDDLLARFQAGDRGALARLITLVENRAPEVAAVMEQLYPLTGKAHVIGITGPPGAGKSTLINLMIARLRALGQKVAVLAIDPSSPFSGGAVLGDRVRMTDHYRDSGVYIRSLSTRGSHGGLSRAAREVMRLLEAFGHDTILIETVGVGQTELDVMDLAQTVIVVLVPESGDSVQVMKAGLNEIADIFVVNKADRGGAERVMAELELSVHLRAEPGWRAPVMLIQANAARGIDELLAEIAKHRDYLRTHQDPRRLGERRAHEFLEVLTAEIEERAVRGLSNGTAPELMDAVRAGELNPYSAARRIIEDRETLQTLLTGPPREHQ
ncbi:MAG TPA: methylmalonyl Co-A mutase-associated GTPase MeaB [Candidatus Binataceae bacterium]|nr:methylmalonyl Co-A mutase-associated GTPase MeaB [Candidatus Binataceae bacterium]